MKPSESPDTSRNRRIGWLALLLVVALAVAAFYLQQRRNQAERAILEKADREMGAGLRGDCEAYLQGQRLYLDAMRFHLQDKKLAAKATISGELAQLCRAPQPEAIASRNALLASGQFQFADVRALTIAYLASGDREKALKTLGVLPNDPFCRWFTQWIGQWPH